MISQTGTEIVKQFSVQIKNGVMNVNRKNEHRSVLCLGDQIRAKFEYIHVSIILICLQIINV